MYMRHKLVILLLFCVFAGCTFYFNVVISPTLESNLFSLLGILFGFTITAAVSMRGSDFLRKQSKIIDDTVRGVFLSNTQRLCSYISFSCTLNLFLISVLTVRGLLNLDGLPARVLTATIAGLITVTLFASYLVLRLVILYIRSAE